MKNLIKTVFIFLTAISIVGCSNDDETLNPVDDRSFTTNATTDFFINKDGTVNISVSGTLQDNGSIGNVINRGFVYGMSSQPEVNPNNTAMALGEFDSVTGYIEGLTPTANYFIRGYFEYDDGTFFYGNEMQVSTDIDASTNRTISLDLESEAFLIQTNFITVTININAVEKEMPIEVGVEYSLSSDFSNSSSNAVENFSGAHNQGTIVVTSYSAVAEPLQSETLYYFRPYAKYADETFTNGGTSTASFTTN
ncbi:hypothetical protein [Winogradskyella rapida]|uniref:DUF3823 domain-containing protein n=1 Tax=Winogradskyella rapida TaxID=549701 RepID=A0ABW3KNV7_9FLAO